MERQQIFFLLVLKPIWKFVRDYIVRLGILDGYYGYVICSLSSKALFIKYLKMIETNEAG
jgi:hypothetical protein